MRGAFHGADLTFRANHKMAHYVAFLFIVHLSSHFQIDLTRALGIVPRFLAEFYGKHS